MEEASDRLPDEAEIAAINATHLISTPLKPADLLFVFGTREDEALRADESFRLWREGLFRWSIVSGGITPGSTRSECEIIKSAMVARGIPSERILEEHRSTNTGENVVFSLPVIDAALGLKNIRSVICLGNTWTARRYPMTLHRHWPEVEKMLVTVDSFATPLSLWHTDFELRRRILSEWDKIEPYKAKGFYRGVAGGLRQLCLRRTGAAVIVASVIALSHSRRGYGSRGVTEMQHLSTKHGKRFAVS